MKSVETTRTLATPMLKKLTIHKFRCCEETTVDLDRPLSALCGKNGVGKSTILQAVDRVARAAVFSAPSVWMSSGFDEPFSIELELVLAGVHCTYFMHNPSSQPGIPNLAEEFSILDEEGSRNPIFFRNGIAVQMNRGGSKMGTSQWTPATAFLMALLQPDDPDLPHVKALAEFLDKVRYYPLNTTGLEERSVSERDYLNWKGRYEADGLATDSVVLRLVYLRQQKRDRFDEILGLLGPDGLDLIEDISILNSGQGDASTGANGGLPPEARLYIPLFKIAEAMGGAGKNLVFADLSDGTRRIIRLVTSLIFDQRSLMMIEQPEDAIHPGLLYKLIDLLKTYSDRTQVILATHSPTVLDTLEPEDILLVTAPRGVTRARRLSAGDLDHARSFLQDNGSLSEFLEPMVEEFSVEDAG